MFNAILWLARSGSARKQTKDKREDRRLQVIELRILGHSNEEIASITQASLRAVILWIKGYTECGIDALRNKKRVGNHRNL
ncbi:MAG: helix-turn-helix domain-containing protein, partial [Peptostreptococcaceae bacterium]|nr:helix-turn-helix domain-containing protein [Peptostreptococcaceae bacterium]